MGCLGDVDSGCCLVCLVACLVDWLCAFGVVDVLIFDSLGLLTTLGMMLWMAFAILVIIVGIRY